MKVETPISAALDCLRQALRCPSCRGTLQNQENALLCEHCRESYPIVGDVPVLLTSAQRQAVHALEEKGLLSGGWGGNALLHKVDALSPWLGRLAWWLYPPPPTLNVIPAAKYRAIADCLRPPNTSQAIVNVGSGRGGGVGHRLWRYIGPDVPVVDVDLAPFPESDLVAEAAALPLAPESVHAVVLQAVLEHVPDPVAVISEAQRVLSPGGYLYIEVPFLQGFHPDPGDYQRFTLEGLHHLLGEFDLVASGVSIGPVSALCWHVRELACLLAPAGLPRLAVRYSMSWLLAPWRYLDWLLARSPYAQRIACEIYALARKPL